MAPLANIKNLKHLSIVNGINWTEFCQIILLNSMSTLRSLDIRTNQYALNFLEDWERKTSGHHALTKQNHGLAVLKSFTLSGASIDVTFMKSIPAVIDFMRLRELTLEHLYGDKHLFFQHLTSLMESSQNNATGISLRTLRLEMAESGYMAAAEETQTNFGVKCRLISSFDTLTALETKGHNQYSDTIAINPGLSNELLQAILKHRNLRSLKISYDGILSGRKIPYLSASTVATIVENLPQLKIFEFAPEEAEIVRNFQYLMVQILLTRINRMQSEKRSPVALTFHP
jgi:hypothetical protein